MEKSVFPIGELDIEVLDGDRGKNYPHQDELYEKGHCLFLSAANVTSSGFRFETTVFISKEKDEILRGGKLRRNDIVITTRGTVGNVAYYDECIPYEDIRINSGMLIVRCGKGINSEYIYYVLRSPEFQKQVRSIQTGSAQPQLPKSHFLKMLICVPEMETQNIIASILSALDRRIESNARINDNLQQQVATIFHQWFVANPESENWPLVTLDSLTSLVSRGIAPKYTDDSVQIVLNQKCIRDHYIDVSLARRHNPKVITEKWLQYGDLLINSTGEGTLGRAAQVWFVPDNMTVDSHVTIVRPKGPHLLFYIGLWGISHEREIEALHTGSTGQTELPRERVKAMELRLPDNDTLVRFNAVIAPIVSLIITNQQENVRLASIRDALLPKLMSGEVDVSGIQL